MKNESVKKSLEKSENALEETQNGQTKNLQKRQKFAIIAINFVQEQLIKNRK